MKRSFLKFTSRKFISILIIGASVLAFTPAESRAGDNKTNTIEILSSENTTSVKLTGSIDNALFFDVKVNNPNADKFTLVIQAEDGEVLYSKEYY